jgi:hypothetical protein
MFWETFCYGDVLRIDVLYEAVCGTFDNGNKLKKDICFLRVMSLFKALRTNVKLGGHRTEIG